MFLHYILNRNKSSLISRVFWAQVKKPVSNDWVLIVKEDLEDLEIEEDLEDIANVSKKAWKEKVKEAVKKKSFNYLTDQIKQKGLSKLKDLHYSEFKLQAYLSGLGYPTVVKKFAFKIRSRMVPVGGNFGNKDLCPLCNLRDDDQRHLQECLVLKIATPQLLDTINDTHYEDVYSEDSVSVMNIATKLYKSYKNRELIIDEAKRSNC